jgi:hypothetical protein
VIEVLAEPIATLEVAGRFYVEGYLTSSVMVVGSDLAV